MTRVVVCGHAVVDFVFTLDEMPRLSEKYRADGLTVIGGGGGANAAVAIARLGGDAALVGRLGDDAIGDMIVSDLEREGVDCKLVDRAGGGRSSLSSVFVDAAGERQIVNFRGEGLAASPSDTFGPFDAALADTRWPAGAVVLFDAARVAGVPAVLDAEAPVPLDLAEAATHVAFSEQGLRDFTGCESAEDGLKAAASRLPGWVAVTLGSAGVMVSDKGVSRCISGFAVEVRDTLAAGDIWHGAFALALGEGMIEDAAVRFANAAAALKCTALGGRAATPSRADVAAFMGEEG